MESRDLSMSAALPHAFLFRARCGVLHSAAVPRSGARLLQLSPAHRLQDLSPLEQLPPGREPLQAELRLAWNENGLAIAAQVKGLAQPPAVNASNPRYSEGVTIWLDTRPTQKNHRATRHCHQLGLFPHGGGASRREPIALPLPISRAKEEAKLIDPTLLRLASGVAATEYWLEAWLPKESLTGFAPDESPQLGFAAMIRSAQGTYYTGVGEAFPIATDPSLWMLLELLKPEAGS